MRPTLALLLATLSLAPIALISACVGDTPSAPTPDAATGDTGTTLDAAADTAVVDAADGSVDAKSDAALKLPVVSSLKLWFRADSPLSKPSAGVTWADQGPFALDAVAAADAGAGSSPSNKQNYFPNGMPGVTFDADPQLLRIADAPQITDLKNGVSIFVVGIPTASKASQWISFGASTATSRVTMGQNGSVIQVALGATVYTANGTTGAVPVNENHAFAATIRGTGGADSIAFYRDGVAAGTATGTALQNTSRALNTIGGTQSGSTVNTAPIGFGEIIVYSKVVTPGELTDIEAYLKARWGTP